MYNLRFLRYHKPHHWALPQPLEYSLPFFHSATLLVLMEMTLQIADAV
jgi:hypothetical protein